MEKNDIASARVLLPRKTALLIVDVQVGFDDPEWGKRNNPDAENNIKKLLAVWRRLKRPIIHIQHLSNNIESSLHPNNPGCAIKELVKPLPHELIIQKNVNSAFIGTGLESELRNKDIKTLIIVGLTTDHCISTTARMAGNLGFNTYVVSDATATFDRLGVDGKLFHANIVHELSLASLDTEFATIINTENLLTT